MAKRAAAAPRRADDKRTGGTSRNPKTVAAPTAKKTAVPAVPAYKKGTGRAGRPKKVT